MRPLPKWPACATRWPDLHDALGDKLAAEVGVPEGFKDAPRGPRGPRGDRGPAMVAPVATAPAVTPATTTVPIAATTKS